MKKITKKQTLHSAMHVMKCPECGKICASASEIRLLPSWTICSTCNENEVTEISEKQQIRISELTEKYGINKEFSRLEKDTDGVVFYNFKSAFGNGYACIQGNGEIAAGNLGYFEPLKQ